MIFAFKLKWWKESKCSQIWAVAASHSSPFFTSMSYTSAHPMSIIYQQVWIIQNLTKVQLLRPGFNKSDDDPHMCHEKNLRHAMQSLGPMARSVQTSKGAYWCPTVKLSLWSRLGLPERNKFPIHFDFQGSSQKASMFAVQVPGGEKRKNPHLKLGVGTIWNLISGYISESSPRLNASLTFLDQTTKHMPSPRHSEYRVREPCWFCLAPCSSRELKSTTEPAGTTTSTILSRSPACQIPTKKESKVIFAQALNQIKLHPIHCTMFMCQPLFLELLHRSKHEFTDAPQPLSTIFSMSLKNNIRQLPPSTANISQAFQACIAWGGPFTLSM